MLKPHNNMLQLDTLERCRKLLEDAGSLAARNEHPEAVNRFRQFLAIMPESHDVRQVLALSLAICQDFEAAIKELGLVLTSQPDNEEAKILLARVYLESGHATEAALMFKALAERHPEESRTISGLANSLYALDRYDEARQHVELYLLQHPDDTYALESLARIERTENTEKSLQLYRRLITAAPGNFLIRQSYATLLLSLGRYEEGWQEYEFRIPALKISGDILAIPRWQGQSLEGKNIVLLAEQGHGDAIQFARYATLVAGLGARVMVLCHNDQIRPLIAQTDGVSCAVIPHEPLPFMPDYHAPLMSLPLLFGTTLANIPLSPGYIVPDPQKKKAWEKRLEGLSGLKVGLVWSGNPAQADNHKRSVPSGQLLPLLEVAGISFVSLQLGDKSLHNHAAISGIKVHDWTDELHDLTDTAALASSLDLVVSICSGVTHLCGALGIPAWVMLRYDADWRWLREREDSPWYQSVRLFRQQRPGDWQEVVARVAGALAERAASVSNQPRMSADQLYDLGVRCFGSGDLKGAEANFRAALLFNGSHGDALNGLATVLDIYGDTETAIQLYLEAHKALPHDATIAYNLANSMRKFGQIAEAEVFYRKAVQLKDDFVQASTALGNLLIHSERFDEALQILEDTFQRYPDNTEVLNALGLHGARTSDFQKAIEWYQKSIAVDPCQLDSLNQLAMLLMRFNRLGEAEGLLHQALLHQPNYEPALNNLGVLLHWTGKWEEAEACHRRLVALSPQKGTPHYNLALVLLSRGNFEQGWQEYEWRFNKDNPVPVHHGNLPRWKGENLRGRKILVHTEQGYGDTIQFARYLSLLASMGAEIVFELQDQVIAPLFSNCGLKQLIVRGDAVPEVDFQIPLMSLPSALGEISWHEPVAVDYLAAEQTLKEVWREKLVSLPGLKVGVVWSGRRGQDNNHNRMIPPEIFAGLAEVDGVSFVNLLVGVDDAEAEKKLEPLTMHDFRGEIKSFADTAALVSCLDLTISVDTATAHLAGAMAKDAWVMIPYNADWRWAFGLPDCPLYPTVRLYRQEQPFAWQNVIDHVRRDLYEWVQQKQNSAESFLRLARQMKDDLHWSEAVSAYRQALEFEISNLEALTGVGACMQMMNRTTEAVSWYEMALGSHPEDSALHCNYAIALLNAGNYPDGWREFQWRKKMISDKLPPFPFLRPEDLDGNLTGKTILLHTEQGFGDTLQCIRYVALLAERGANTIISSPPELERLLQYSDGVHEVVVHGNILPPCDFQSLTMDLPWVFGTTVQSIPDITPYIKIDEKLKQEWSERLGKRTKPRIGILWKGSKGNRLNFKLRSIGLETFEPLLAITGVTFYSLQVGSDALIPDQREQYDNLVDLTYLIHDFADTAALISNLDHVVTIDSAVAHLAGALGKPVALVLPEYRDWRWLEQSGYSLWHPRTKIFRIQQQSDIVALLNYLKQTHVADLQKEKVQML